MSKFKIEIEVPDSINWIACDEDGRWYGYKEKPYINSDYSDHWNSLGKEYLLASVGPTKNWKDELYEWVWV